MNRTRLVAWRLLICAMIATLVLAPLAAAQVIVVPKIKGKLIDVVIREGSIQMPAVVAKGWVTLRITNAGQENHSLTLMGHGKIHSLPIALPPGHAALMPIKLKEAVYTVWCQMQGHADSGERVSLVVVDD